MKIEQSNNIDRKNEAVLSRRMSLMLVLVQIANVLTLAGQLSTWFIALSSLTFIWQYAIYSNLIAKPTRVTKILVAVIGCMSLIITGPSLGILLGMLHLLCLAYILKPLELFKRRDLYQIFVLGILIIASSLIFYQSIGFSVVILLLLIMNFSWLSALFVGSPTIINQIKLSGKMVCLSVPLALILFIVFPKLPPFWQMPASTLAKTGLSDTVKVGDISQLALSNELAFRVEFTDNQPLYNQMYWRALVLDSFDGQSWRKSLSKRYLNLSKFQRRPIDTTPYNASRVDYQLIVEPSNQHWLFSLDVPEVTSAAGNKRIYHLNDYTLYSEEKLSQRFSYNVSSYLQIPLDKELSQRQLARYLQIDGQDNPRLSQYGSELRSTYGQSAMEIVNEVLARFNQQPYRYTLTPPQLTNHSLDQFFFSTKAGFCEHYASSFTYLMRGAGVPARLVLGYMGGELNEQGNYYSVYQRDAHAWSEVWIRNKGWLRVDPTAAVDPSRVEQGFSQQLLQEQQRSLGHFNMSNLFAINWLSGLKRQFDALDYQWTKFVIGYSIEKQRRFLEGLFGSHIKYKTMLVIVVFLTIFTVSLWGLYQRRDKQPQLKIWLKYFEQAQFHLAKLGLSKNNDMSDQEFINQLHDRDRLLGRKFVDLYSTFSALQYQAQSDKQQEVLIWQMKTQLALLLNHRLSADS